MCDGSQRQAGTDIEVTPAMVEAVKMELLDAYEEAGVDGIPYLELTASYLAERVVRLLLQKLARLDHAPGNGQRTIFENTH